MPVYTYEEIENQIKSRKLHAVYLLHGLETFFTDQLTELFIHHLMDESEQAFNMDVLTGKETSIQQIIDCLSQFPMGSDYRLVVVRNAQEVKNLEELHTYVNAPFESSILVLSHSGKAIDGRKKLGISLKSSQGVFESKPLYDNNMPGWIRELVKKGGKEINIENATLVADYLGTDLKKVANEINKTIIAIGDDKEITRNHIEEYIGINREFNVFELVSALFLRNPFKAQMIIRFLAGNMNRQPFFVILATMFASFLRLYHVIASKAASDAQITGIINSRSISAIKEYRTAAGYYNLEDMHAIMGLFKYYDQASKGIHSTLSSDGELLKEMVFKILHIKELRPLNALGKPNV